MRPGSKPTSSAKKQNRHCVKKWATAAQAIGQGGEAFGGGLGDVAAGLFGAKALGVQPQAAQQGLLVGLVHLMQEHGVYFRRVAVELGVYAQDEAVARHQQGRVAERQAVGEQLLEGAAQIAAGGFVFPRKVGAVKHVGIATGLAQHQGVLLKEVVAVTARKATRQGHAQQLAQVDEMGLRALRSFRSLAGPPGPHLAMNCWGGHGRWVGECHQLPRSSMSSAVSISSVAALAEPTALRSSLA